MTEEPLWQEGPYTSTHPVTRIYSQNADFSTFPLLCERVYTDLEAENPRLRREMPFCTFQHVMTSILKYNTAARMAGAMGERDAQNEHGMILFRPLCVSYCVSEHGNFAPRKKLEKSGCKVARLAIILRPTTSQSRPLLAPPADRKNA